MNLYSQAQTELAAQAIASDHPQETGIHYRVSAQSSQNRKRTDEKRIFVVGENGFIEIHSSAYASPQAANISVEEVS
ncbi:MAG: hypothetical protein SWJ54_13760 [Cyanobacteriota bacterium]|nr:hypothetical protein [Cyanobacteriota bacterium]